MAAFELPVSFPAHPVGLTAVAMKDFSLPTQALAQLVGMAGRPRRSKRLAAFTTGCPLPTNRLTASTLNSTAYSFSVFLQFSFLTSLFVYRFFGGSNNPHLFKYLDEECSKPIQSVGVILAANMNFSSFSLDHNFPTSFIARTYVSRHSQLQYSLGIQD